MCSSRGIADGLPAEHPAACIGGPGTRLIQGKAGAVTAANSGEDLREACTPGSLPCQAMIPGRPG